MSREGAEECRTDGHLACLTFGGSEKWLGIEMAEIKHVLNIFQGLASAVHNVDRGHSPVFIFAGAAPQSSDSRLKGTKNEWPMWLQGAVSFYCLGTWHTLNLP